MNKWFRGLTIALCGITLSACSMIEEKPAPRGTIVDYTESVAGTRINVRYIVFPDMLRVEYGTTGNKYTLYDRATKTIYDVDERDKAVAVIQGEAPPMETAEQLGITITETASELVGNGSSTLYRFIKNNEQCLNAVVVKELLPAVEQAMLELAAVRANDPRLKDIDKNSCEYVLRVVSPRIIPTLGLPVRQWSNTGYSKFIDGYDIQVEIPEENIGWDQLPEWYEAK